MNKILTIIILCLTLNVKAQTTLPDSITKKVIIELIQKDSMQNELYYSQIHLNLLNNKLNLKDSIINIYKTNEINYTKQLNILNKENNKLNKNNKSLRLKGRLLGTTSTLLLGTIGVLILIK